MAISPTMMAEIRRELLERTCKLLESGTSINSVKNRAAPASIADLWFVVENLQTRLVEAKRQSRTPQRPTLDKEDHPHDLAAIAAKYAKRIKEREQDRLVDADFWKKSNEDWRMLFANERREKANEESMFWIAGSEDFGAYHDQVDDIDPAISNPVAVAATLVSSNSTEMPEVYRPSKASRSLKILFTRPSHLLEPNCAPIGESTRPTEASMPPPKSKSSQYVNLTNGPTRISTVKNPTAALDTAKNATSSVSSSLKPGRNGKRDAGSKEKRR
jgi:hypothetical protein